MKRALQRAHTDNQSDPSSSVLPSSEPSSLDPSSKVPRPDLPPPSSSSSSSSSSAVGGNGVGVVGSGASLQPPVPSFKTPSRNGTPSPRPPPSASTSGFPLPLPPLSSTPSSSSSSVLPPSAARRQSTSSSNPDLSSAGGDSSWYLKLQNAALVTELKRLRPLLRDLEDERDKRRRAVGKALKAVCDIGDALCCVEDLPAVKEAAGLAAAAAAANAEEGSDQESDEDDDDDDADADGPSTGAGADVELTGPLLASLAGVAGGQDGATALEHARASNRALRDNAERLKDRTDRLKGALQSLLDARMLPPPPPQQQQDGGSGPADMDVVVPAAPPSDGAGAAPAGCCSLLSCSLSLRERASAAAQYKAECAALTAARDEALKRASSEKRRTDRQEAALAVNHVAANGFSAGDGVDGTTATGEGGEGMALDGEHAVGAAQHQQASSQQQASSHQQQQQSAEHGISQALAPSDPTDRQLLEHRRHKIDELLQANAALNIALTDARALIASASRTAATVPDTVVRVHPAFEAVAADNARLLAELRTKGDLVGALSGKYAAAKGQVEAAEAALKELRDAQQAAYAGVLAERDDAAAKLKGAESERDGATTQMQESQRQAEALRAAGADIRMQAESLAGQVARLTKATTDLARDGNMASTAAAAKGAETTNDKDLAQQNATLRAEVEYANAASETLIAEIESLSTEHEAATKTISRLQRQLLEKEEVNNKSMSEVIRLKGLLEQAKDDRAALQAQAKEAEQLALAARLASNNCKKIEEEYSKEVRSHAVLLDTASQQLAQLRESLSKSEAESERLRGVLSAGAKESAAARERLDELVGAATAAISTRNGVEEELIQARAAAASAAAQAQASAANSRQLTEQLALSGGGGGGGGGNNVQHLEMVVKAYRSKLFCHVCNEREKKCMIMICRHMFCNECIATRIENRARKCPSCGKGFGKDDVQSIWLTG